MTSSSSAPVAQVELLIRCARGQAFSAFVEPEQLTRFWLSKASGRLEPGRQVRWEFLVPGAAADVTVENIVENESIRTVWEDGSHVEWTFAEHALGGTVVAVTQWGFPGGREEVLAQALDATSGFTLVLAELKVLLEQGRGANIVSDKAALIAAQHLKH
ncbi:MAG: hypothetical protein RL685_1769 [Pseudomonadota bacterium]|jgi:uncharacterized protein YndB with AHSA1/START domain